MDRQIITSAYQRRDETDEVRVEFSFIVNERQVRDIVTVYFQKSFGGKVPKATINWGAIGACSPEATAAFLLCLTQAHHIAEALNAGIVSAQLVYETYRVQEG